MKMTVEMAMGTRNRYLCAKCWGNLTVKLLRNERMADVACAQCGNETFVTRSGVERMKVQSRAQYNEAHANLYQYFAPRKKRSSEEIIKELGY